MNENTTIEDIDTILDDLTPITQTNVEQNLVEPLLEKGSTLGALGNLTNTILGAGMLSISYALSTAGLVLGGLILALAAWASIFGLHLLSIAARAVPRAEGENYRSSYFAVASVTFPRAAIVIDVAVVIKCLGVGISYLIVAGQLMADACQQYREQIGPVFAYALDPRFWIGMSLFICIPISLIKRMDSMKYVSYFALCTVVYLLVVTIYYFFTDNRGFLPSEFPLFKFDVRTVSNFPVFIFAYACHQNLFTIYNDLHGDRASVDKVIIGANVISMGSYVVMSYIGYLTYESAIKNNIILNFPQSVVTFICRIVVFLLVIFSYPLQIHPCRISIENLLRELIPLRYMSKMPDLVLHIAMSLFIFVATFLVAFFAGGNLTTVFGVVGATASTTMGYILPASFYLKLKWRKPWRCRKISAAIMGVSGVLLMINSLVFIVINAANS